MDEAEKCSRVGLMHNGNFIVCDSPDKLKAYMKNAILEVWCADSRKARGLLKALEGVESVYPFGDVLHLIYKGPSAGKPEEEKIRNILKQNSIELFDAHKISPSFEDVYISLIEKN